MKKALSILLAAVMAFGAFAALPFAADDIKVYVSVADSKGKISLARASIIVSDSDSDGRITISDALYCAHEEYYTGGAAAGFATEQTVYGTSLTKLWGETNGGSLGYYLNNASPLSLGDAVKSGDSVYAFAYTDTTAWSDTYSFFASDAIEVTQYDTAELELKILAFDLTTFTYAASPAVGASITVDGEATQYKTDENGKVTIELNSSGTHVISAVSDTMTLVPPVCVAEVERASLIATVRYYFNRLVAAVTALIAQIIGNK